MSAPCPSEDDLLALATGSSAGARQDDTLAHLEICADCRALVSELLRENVGGDVTEFPDAEPAAAAARSSLPQPGDLIAGKFRLGRIIGEGGMGVVMEAEHTLLEERVALKFMHAAVAAHPDAAVRFLREARASSKIRSEHVARVLDVGTHEGMPYLVMEYLEGSDLAALLSREGPLSPERAVDYVLQACEALGRAHEQGLVHRDLKPANLFLTTRPGEKPILKVLDFGIAKALDKADVPAMTASNAFLGSPRYMAPEQVQNARDVDARADIWALGAILFELVVGRPAFDQASVAALLVAICTQPAPQLSTIRTDVPESLSRTIADCLRIDPARRPASIEALGARLRGERVDASAPASSGSSLRPVWVAAPVLAIGFVIGFGMLSRSAPARRSQPAPLLRAAFGAARSADPVAPRAPAAPSEAVPSASVEPRPAPRPTKPTAAPRPAPNEKANLYDKRK